MTQGHSLHQQLWNGWDDGGATRSASAAVTTVDVAVSPVTDVADVPGDSGSAGVRMTAESIENIQRAPAGTRFFCMASDDGETHCAASRGPQALEASEQSKLRGVVVDPIAPGRAGTGHQQVAKLAGMKFDEATARVGYVEGEGLGLSVTKHDDCRRSYSFTSAFNIKVTPNGSRTLPSDVADPMKEELEASFPPCRLRP